MQLKRQTISHLFDQDPYKVVVPRHSWCTGSCHLTSSQGAKPMIQEGSPTRTSCQGHLPTHVWGTLPRCYITRTQTINPNQGLLPIQGPVAKVTHPHRYTCTGHTPQISTITSHAQQQLTIPEGSDKDRLQSPVHPVPPALHRRSVLPTRPPPPWL